MKIFLDTANLDEIRKWSETGIIDGVTTNPTHLAKEGGDPKKLVIEICSILKEGEISVEVTQKSPIDVYNQAKEIAALSSNILVKIPCHKSYYEVIKKLVDEEIPLNITLVFTVLQSLMMAKLGVVYISPFIGRWDDIEVNGIEIIKDIRTMLDEYDFETELLAASIRTVTDFSNSVLAGSDAVTLPGKILQKSLEHPLTNLGIEKFDNDWKKLGINKFP